MGQIDRQLVTACQAGCGYDRRLIPSINCDGVSGPGGISLSNRGQLTGQAMVKPA